MSGLGTGVGGRLFALELLQLLNFIPRAKSKLKNG